MITSNQVHVDAALGQISIAYNNPAFVFESKVFPVVPVDKDRDIFFKFSKQHFRQQPDAGRPGTIANELPLDLDARGAYVCDGHKLDLPTPDEISANADPGADLDVEVTQKTTAAIRLNEEIYGQGLITTGNITQNVTLSGTSQWSDFLNSNPILAIDQAKITIQQATGLLPNRLLISEYTYLTLRNHPLIIDRIKYTGEGLRKPLTADDLAEAFGLEEVVIAAGLKQTAAEGQTDALGYIWGKNALLYYAPPRPGKRIAALGYTFVWMLGLGKDGRLRGDLGNNTGGFLVRRYRSEKRRSDVIGVDFYYAQVFIDVNCGYLFVNCVA